MFKAQMNCHEKIVLQEKNMNEMHPFSYLASKDNEDVLCCHQCMQEEDADLFKEAIGKEIKSLKTKESLK